MKALNTVLIIAVFTLFSGFITACTQEENQTDETNTVKIDEVVTEPVVSSTTPEVEINAVVEPKAVVSTYSKLMENAAYKAYFDIKTDMTKEEVDTVLGAGIAGEKDSFAAHLDPFTYEKDGIQIWISYNQGKVASKGIADITDWDVVVSKDDFLKLKNGLSYDDVKIILGEGQLTNESAGSQTYFWNIKTGYQNIRITFKDGVVSYISDMNMD